MCTSTNDCVFTATSSPSVTTWPNYGAYNVAITRSFNGTPQTPGTATGAISSTVDPQGCPDCPVQGTPKPLSGSGTTVPASTCSGSCMYTYKGPVSTIIGSSWASTFVATGQACQQVTGGNGAPTATPNDCNYAGGTMICSAAAENRPDCNRIDGQLVCSNFVNNGCAATESGAVVCVRGTPATTTNTPAGGAPNNGTSGQPATPTAQTAVATGSPPTGASPGQDIYGPSVVGGSSGGISTGGGSSSSSGGGGSSSSSSGGVSSSSTSSSSSSSSEGTCSGDGCTLEELEEVGTFGEIIGGFNDRVMGSPLIDAASSISGSVPSGVCPTGSVNLFGDSIALNSHCTLYEDISGYLEAIFLAGWAFLGLRIILSA